MKITSSSFTEQVIHSEWYNRREWRYHEIARVAFNALVLMPLIAPAGALCHGTLACVYWVRAAREKSNECMAAAIKDFKAAAPLLTIAGGVYFAACYLHITALAVLFPIGEQDLDEAPQVAELPLPKTPDEAPIVADVPPTQVLEPLIEELPPLQVLDELPPPKVLDEVPPPKVLDETPLVAELPPQKVLDEATLVELPLTLEETSLQLKSAELELADTLLTRAYIWLISNQVKPDYQIPWNGNTIANQVAAVVHGLNENQKRDQEEIIALLRSKQKAIDALMPPYCKAGGNEDTLLDVYDLIFTYRTRYNQILGQTEYDMLHLAVSLNAEIDSWKTILCKKMPYKVPMKGVEIMGRISDILRLYKEKLGDKKTTLEEMSAAAVQMQTLWDLYRLADLYLQNLISPAHSFSSYSRPPKKFEALVLRRQPSYFINFSEAIAANEEAALWHVLQANNLLTTIKGDMELPENVRNSIIPIAYSCPLDLKAAYEKVSAWAKKVTVQSYVSEINEHTANLRGFYAIITLLRQLHKETEGVTHQPALYMDKARHYKLFYEGFESLQSEEMLQERFKAALKNCTVTSGTTDKTHFNEFKNRIIEAQQGKAASPFVVLGLKPDCSEKELKSAQKKYAFALHPDKNPDTPDAQTLFDCMNELYAICLVQCKK